MAMPCSGARSTPSWTGCWRGLPRPGQRPAGQAAAQAPGPHAELPRPRRAGRDEQPRRAGGAARRHRAEVVGGQPDGCRGGDPRGAGERPEDLPPPGQRHSRDPRRVAPPWAGSRHPVPPHATTTLCRSPGMTTPLRRVSHRAADLPPLAEIMRLVDDDHHLVLQVGDPSSGPEFDVRLAIDRLAPQLPGYTAFDSGGAVTIKKVLAVEDI